MNTFPSPTVPGALGPKAPHRTSQCKDSTDFDFDSRMRPVPCKPLSVAGAQ
jgi:hypothetical protein